MSRETISVLISNIKLWKEIDYIHHNVDIILQEFSSTFLLQYYTIIGLFTIKMFLCLNTIEIHFKGSQMSKHFDDQWMRGALKRRITHKPFICSNLPLTTQTTQCKHVTIPPHQT